MPERISRISHEYAGRRHAPGERLNVEPEHVALLLALGRIEPEEVETRRREMSAGEAAQYQTREVRPGRKNTRRKAA